MPAITELAHAKVNLTLSVRGRRPDGYHEIESLITFASLGDVVRFTPGAKAPLSVSGPFAGAIAGDNLIETALVRLAEAEPRLRLGAVALEKSLPIAAGLGGGSADAAALLRAVRSANPGLAAEVDWTGVAAHLGADVPVCLLSRPAFVSGTGEILTPMPGLPRLAAVLANSMAPVPLGKTARVFGRLKAPPAGPGLPPRAPGPFADAAVLIAYMAARGNDLMSAARQIEPAIGEVHAALTAAPGCRFAGLSGAGPTCFGIFDDAEAAAAGEARLRAAQPGWWVAATELGG